MMWGVSNIGTKIFLNDKVVYLQDRHILEKEPNDDMNDKVDYKINEYTEKLNRGTGRTTRIVDSTIQYMFKHPNEWVEIIDHFPTRQANEMVAEKINFRLQNEHNCRLVKHNGLYKIRKNYD